MVTLKTKRALCSGLTIWLAIRISFGQSLRTHNDRITTTMIEAALGCLLQERYALDDFSELELKSGSNAEVRYHEGEVTGLSKEGPEVQIAVYSPDGANGWLFLAYFSRRGVLTPVTNAYRLRKHGARWTADEGNGGIATYSAMSRFANKLSKSQPVIVRLAYSRRSCPAIQ